MKVNKKITAMLLSAVIAAAPAAAPIMEVQTVVAATTTTKTLKMHGAKIVDIIMTKMVRRLPV